MFMEQGRSRGHMALEAKAGFMEVGLPWNESSFEWARMEAC